MAKVNIIFNPHITLKKKRKENKSKNDPKLVRYMFLQ